MNATVSPAGDRANPYGDAGEQVSFLSDGRFHAEYYLTQIVSHLNIEPVERFIRETRNRGVDKPGIFGIFFYRSANPKTLAALRQFLPVPAEGLTREFGAGATAVDVCARTLRAMIDAGARHFYISNLPLDGAAATLSEILDRVGVSAS